MIVQGYTQTQHVEFEVYRKVVQYIGNLIYKMGREKLIYSLDLK